MDREPVAIEAEGAERLRIAVLIGGVSSERKVSLKSGNAVAAALRLVGHEVSALDIVAEDVSDVVEARPDVAFIALHGRFGEDGGAQALLEQAGIPFTGSDAEASRTAMDKLASKCAFLECGVPTPDFRLVTAAQQPDGRAARRAIQDLGLPLVVKPLCQGSSLGVTIAHTESEAIEGLAAAFAFDEQALLERYVAGREVTVGVLGEEALPVVELRPARGFFDYEAKYADPRTQYIVSPDMDPTWLRRAQRVALAAHRALGCWAMSRVDMILDAEGQPQVLEVNTIPGMTERSLFPMAARAAGVGFPALCDRLVRAALHARRPLPAPA